MHKRFRSIFSFLILFSSLLCMFGTRGEEPNQTRSGGDISIDGDKSKSADNVNLKSNPKIDDFRQVVFADVVSQNSGITNEISIGGQPEPITTLSNGETDQPKVATEHPPFEETKKDSDQPPPEKTSKQDEVPPPEQTKPIPEKSPVEISAPKKNKTAAETEDMPSFSEWAQKRLEEAEKSKEHINISNLAQSANGGKPSGAKMRWKNYASLDCGAKIVAANPEAVSPSAVLSPSRDEYKLNTCTSRIWFIVELCEAIQAKKIDIANFELFSSSPKDFTVSVSDRFPTRDWSVVGQFAAKDERDVQSFDLHPQLFGKYIKVEIKSHYGAEHYCPISLFRVYGTSEIEVLEKEGLGQERGDEDDDDDETLDVETDDSVKNLLNSATDAVFSMFKKAAQVLNVNKGNNTNATIAATGKPQLTPPNACSSPSHLIVCDNCSDALFGQVYELLSCKSAPINDLISVPLIRKTLTKSDLCRAFGLKFDATERSKWRDCLAAFFADKYLGAMCNAVAVSEKKVVLNVTSQYPNATKKVDDVERLVVLESSETAPGSQEAPAPTQAIESTPTTELKLATTTPAAIPDSSHIQPSKTLTDRVEIPSSDPSSQDVMVTATDTLKTAAEDSGEENKTEAARVAPSIAEATSESAEGQEEHLVDQFADLNVENGDGGSQTSSTANSAPQMQKESVFLRLSNRIKALERNLSLSSQYLEELSKRYKKQVEEMQALLDKTLHTLNEESKRMDERSKNLEERVNALTILVERNTWSAGSYWFFFTVVLVVGFCSFCWRTTNIKSPMEDEASAGEKRRRKSIDVVTHKTTKKVRRPSDQALRIVRSSAIGIDEKLGHKERKRRKRKSGNVFAVTKLEGSDWVENQRTEDIPFALDEPDNPILEYIPVTDEEKEVKLVKKHNGSALQNHFDAESIVSVGHSINGQSLSSNGPNLVDCSPKKERKGFKRIFRKVF